MNRILGTLIPVLFVHIAKADEISSYFPREKLALIDGPKPNIPYEFENYCDMYVWRPDTQVYQNQNYSYLERTSASLNMSYSKQIFHTHSDPNFVYLVVSIDANTQSLQQYYSKDGSCTTQKTVIKDIKEMLDGSFEDGVYTFLYNGTQTAPWEEI